VRYLILSDIHSNWQALQAVLADAEGSYERILCCGDTVGYGADPNAVLEWARANLFANIRGNHDKACSGSEDLAWFNPAARASAIWTLNVLAPENMEYLKHLPKGPIALEGFQIAHGSPLDEDEYVANAFDARQLAPYVEYPVTFFGHTHLQGGFLCHRNGCMQLSRPRPDEREIVLRFEPESLYLVNPGSVGQPRDNDFRAAYALYAPEERIAALRRVPYDIAGAQERIRAQGLPDSLWRRLGAGS
jgi:predicted phosphodiesterase